MKKISFFFSAFITLLLLQTSCNKDGALCFDFAQNTTIATNAAPAGSVTVTKTLSTTLTDQLTSKGVKIENVSSVKVNPITMTIPSSAGYTFDDISAAELSVGSTSLGKLPAGATGLSATFTAPASIDLKSTFLGTTPATMTFTATLKKAVAASTLDVKIPLNTCYQLL